MSIGMLWWIIPVGFMAASTAGIVVVLARRVSQVRMLNVDAIPQEKMRKTKEKIILERLERMSSRKLGNVGSWILRLVRATSGAGRRAVQKAYSLEQYYERLKKASHHTGGAKQDAAVMQKLMAEAAELLREEEYVLAEKKLIEVISHQPKKVDAYEALGNVYIRAKQHGQARETLQFALRLSPEDASVHMSMAELEMLEGNPAAACEQARQSVEKRPHNPKYIDLYIESALAAGLVEEAKKGIELLKSANPENQKIVQFEERVNELA